MPDFILQLWHFDQHLGALAIEHGDWAYALIFAMILLELGVLPMFFLPGNPFVFVCGAFCAQGVMQLPLAAAALWMGMVLGSMLNYVLGRGLVRGIEHWHWRWPDRQALERTHLFCERYGAWSFLVTPYLAVVRTCAPFVGGVARMSPGRFLLGVTGGATLWVLPLLGLGFLFGNQPWVRANFASFIWGGIALGLGGLVIAAIRAVGKKAPAR